MPHAPTSLTHWGGFSADMESGDIASVTPLDGDTDPSPLLGNLPGSIRHRSRIATPAVRRGWLRDGPGPSTQRGADEFVAVSWDELTELLAGELRRVVDTHGNEALYGGSYGWASAGRFHHAQSQVHRFLKLLGGYTFSRQSYSLGATGVIMPRVVGTHDDLFKRSTEWEVIVEHTDLLVCFGGLALKNTGINHGGTTGHPARDALRRFRDRGGRIVSLSPLRDDVEGDCEWHAPVPGTDVAIMLALAYVLATESLADRDFLSTYCTGYDRFERYLLGLDDGVAKSPRWASQICGLPAGDLIALARRMAAGRTIVTVSWSLQRIRHGEQTPWMGLTLAAMLGQIGLPGGGFGHGYGSMNEPGLPPLRFGLPSLPQGLNPVQTFIPVAAISDMLADFRADPKTHRLGTPSGLIEIFSENIDGFGYDDCAGHPTWFEPSEWLGGSRAADYPLHLLANQPATRLHSQLDIGAVSQDSKVQGREPIRIHPVDAEARGLVDGDVVRVFNDRGACLAGVVVDDRLRRDVVQLSTGAWFDPADPTDPDAMCVHGNPNVLTDDGGTSSLARGCTGAHVLVQVEKFTGPLPPMRAHQPPVIVDPTLDALNGLRRVTTIRRKRFRHIATKSPANELGRPWTCNFESDSGRRPVERSDGCHEAPGPHLPDKLRPIWSSPPFPTGPLSVGVLRFPSTAQRIRAAWTRSASAVANRYASSW